ncbi:restriction endonuclease subunit S [Vibrio metschnikovii]|uniref:restriction endonuclease subunit S n=1 Tax=Vibrio sp. A11 TaxID=2591464 RepID=UPI001482520E|nr:restriction endonuclease subunit S [Vibrio sp. A11]EKO3573654.1 restriction endonuclease subunit S [Vibrio metschnikovii]NNN62448.1 restriction endonuclease subunit S [Vibrio sp. A11]
MSNLSYLDKLLDGVEVEWKSLGQLVVDKFWIMPATPKFNEAETIPYITSKNIKGGHINFDKTKFISREDHIELSRNRPILAGDFLISMIGTIGEVAVVKESDLEFYGQNMYLIRLDESVIMSRYFWHFFDSPRMKSYFQAVKNNSGQGYLKANNIDSLEIPIPCPDNPKKSLAIQAEIVRILDAFTAMTAELTAELNMRKKQYNYYRDQLLSFEEGDVEWKTLEDLCASISAGGDVPKNSSKGQTEPTDEYPYPIYANATGEKGLYGFTDDYKIDSDAVTISARGAKVGYHTVREAKFTPIIRLIVLIANKNIISTRYLNYVLDMTPIGGTEAGIPQLTVPMVKKLTVPIPVPNDPKRSLIEQARIVSILDKFDTLTTSIQEGLPREIELRQKQYEYYRDLLLSFPKSHSDEAA